MERPKETFCVSLLRQFPCSYLSAPGAPSPIFPPTPTAHPYFVSCMNLTSVFRGLLLKVSMSTTDATDQCHKAVTFQRPGLMLAKYLVSSLPISHSIVSTARGPIQMYKGKQEKGCSLLLNLKDGSTDSKLSETNVKVCTARGTAAHCKLCRRPSLGHQWWAGILQ